ncbi:formate dehydrogenase accessory protein FdhE [Megalodesulfovibrio paquesii]
MHHPQPTNFNALRAAVRQRLEQLAAAVYVPAPLADLVGQVSLAQLDVLDPAVPAITLAPLAPHEDDLAPRVRLALGVPLLERSRFPWDRVATEQLFFSLAGLLASLPGQAGEAGRRINEALDKGDAGGEPASADTPPDELPPLLPLAAARAFIAEDTSFFEIFAARMPQAPRAVAFLAQAAVTPSLMEVAQSLHSRLDLENDARLHGHCPVCGSLPLIVCLQEGQGTRRLSCSFCRTFYRAHRQGCLLCGEDRAEKLGVLASGEMSAYRVEYCRTCSGYLKGMDAGLREEVFLPVLDDLESLPMDMLAAQAGFRRPTISGLGV